MSLPIITQRLSPCILLKPVNKLLGINQLCWHTVRNLNNNTAHITRIAREVYEKPYQTLVVNPDGSSYYIRHCTPRQIIKLPLDLSTLNETERLQRLERRKPKKKVTIVREEKDSYSASKYLDMIKAKKNK